MILFKICAHGIPKYFQEEQRTFSTKSSTLFDHHEISSTPNTFIETSPNFDLDDYQLDQSSNTRNACAHDENKFSIIIDSKNILKNMENSIFLLF